MKTKVTEQGLLIPKELLEGFDEVEIRREDHQLLIVPVSEDPILSLGREPVLVEINDASVHHHHCFTENFSGSLGTRV